MDSGVDCPIGVTIIIIIVIKTQDSSWKNFLSTIWLHHDRNPSSPLKRTNRCSSDMVLNTFQAAVLIT